MYVVIHCFHVFVAEYLPLRIGGAGQGSYLNGITGIGDIAESRKHEQENNHGCFHGLWL